MNGSGTNVNNEALSDDSFCRVGSVYQSMENEEGGVLAVTQELFKFQNQNQNLYNKDTQKQKQREEHLSLQNMLLTSTTTTTVFPQSKSFTSLHDGLSLSYKPTSN